MATRRKPKQRTTPATETPSNRLAAVSFYSGRLHSVEQATRMVSNEAKYCDPLSLGILTVDWVMQGGVPNVMASVAGEEASAKTTLCNHLMANCVKSESLFTLFIDAEGTLNPKYASSIFRPYGVDLNSLVADNTNPFRYYRENVIETVFDMIHGILKQMPTKFWVSDAKTWAYSFPKRNKVASDAMAAYGLKPDKALTTENQFVCPTDFSGVEAGVFIDSFAAMVSRGDDEDEQKSRQRAVEAQAFSQNLKRVSARASAKGVAIFGTNQLRKIPGVVYGSPFYEPGGEALKFYTSQRLRLASRTTGMIGLVPKRDKETGHYLEPSVHDPKADDHYMYKSVQNTKNKIGNPNKKTWIRVWVSDYLGSPHGVDPYFDVFQHMVTTGQIHKDKRKLRFTVRDSLGSSMLVKKLNDLPVFTEMDLKALVIAEVQQDKQLLIKALAAMGLPRGKFLNLRSLLFKQMKIDQSILNLSPSVEHDKEDYEDDATEM